ncbi:MAG: tRNA epoxyqueuosine(34) reductase QueG [Actinomycetota bacterium]|nr:tRNA epoxyqueuosine(34) reductase QueG [Actinomycetota bacterium]
MSTPLMLRLRAAGTEAGLEAVGVTSAEPFVEAREAIEARKARDFHGGMWFTYGRPERSTDPRRLLPEANSIVVGALGYHRQTDGVPHDGGGLVARYAWEPFYDQLRAALEAMAVVLVDEGHEAVVVLDDNRMVDRAAAYRAGLGWFAKNTNILLGELGSWFVLGSVLTDAELPPSTAPMADGCGSCTRCQIACPTAALDEAGVLDARRCLAWLVQADGAFPPDHRVALGGRLYGCDDCQSVCPPNVKRIRSTPSTALSPGAVTSVDLVGLLLSDDDALMDRHGSWYIPRRRAEYLRRNALVALGNVGPAADPGPRSAVQVSLSSPHAVVRAHAVWAAKRLGHDDLLALVADDDDEDVIDELNRSVEPMLVR